MKQEARIDEHRIEFSSYFGSMIKRDEASRLREEFWTTFGKYMGPIPSSEGVKINWINYKTTFKDLYFRMDADQHGAFIAITMEHKDLEVQALYFEQFLECKTMLHAALGEEWSWQLRSPDKAGRLISRISKEKKGASVFIRDQWPELISFFKPRIIALDQFWENARYSFEALR